MIILYHIKPDTGTVLLEYGESTDSQVVQDFIAHEEVPSYNMISVDDHEQIEQTFLHFKAGTDVQDIWHWFESEFGVSVAEDLMYGKMKS